MNARSMLNKPVNLIIVKTLIIEETLIHFLTNIVQEGVGEGHLGTRQTAAGVLPEAGRTGGPGSALGGNLHFAGRVPDFGGFPWSSCVLLHSVARLALVFCLLRPHQILTFNKCPSNMPHTSVVFFAWKARQEKIFSVEMQVLRINVPPRRAAARLTLIGLSACSFEREEALILGDDTIVKPDDASA